MGFAVMDAWIVAALASFSAVLVVAQLWRKVARRKEDDAYQAALRKWLMELPKEPTKRRTIHIRIPDPPPAKFYHGYRIGFVVYEN